jgi:hypothetical protein
MKRNITLLFIIVIILIGCREKYKIEKVWGEVQEIRVVISSEISNRGNPIGGAIVGGLIAGDTGAIVGAISESSSRTIETRGKVKAVLCLVKLKDGTLLRMSLNEKCYNINSILTLRNGDKVCIIKRTLIGYKSRYFWGSEFGRELEGLENDKM